MLVLGVNCMQLNNDFYQIPWNQFVLVLGVNCMQLNNDFLDLESTTLSLI